MLLGPLISRSASGTVQSGKISGKMIVVACLLDREVFPWQADWYRAKVTEHLGDVVDDHFRLWRIDNVLHGDDDEQEFPGRSVSYLGALKTALRQLAAWVEDGTESALSTSYDLADGQVVLPQQAQDRHGVQPTVAFTLNGNDAVRARVGEPILVRVTAQAPARAIIHEVLSIETEPGGEERLAESREIEPAVQVSVEWRLGLDEPGKYFVAVRVSSRSSGSSTKVNG